MIGEMPPQITRRGICRDSASLDGCRDLAFFGRSKQLGLSNCSFQSLWSCMSFDVVLMRLKSVRHGSSIRHCWPPFSPDPAQPSAFLRENPTRKPNRKLWMRRTFRAREKGDSSFGIKQKALAPRPRSRNGRDVSPKRP
jgi:hypothetical protein